MYSGRSRVGGARLLAGFGEEIDIGELELRLVGEAPQDWAERE